MKTLLLVHAHPDDEAITTGQDGHCVVLVTATRGEGLAALDILENLFAGV